MTPTNPIQVGDEVIVVEDCSMFKLNMGDILVVRRLGATYAALERGDGTLATAPLSRISRFELVAPICEVIDD